MTPLPVTSHRYGWQLVLTVMTLGSNTPCAAAQSLEHPTSVAFEGLLVRQQVFWEHDPHQPLVLGVFMGMCLAMLLYNAFMYALHRERSHLYCALYIASWTLLPACVNGVAVPLLVACCYACMVLFVRRFLQTHRHLGSMDWILKLALLGFVVFGLLGMLWAPAWAAGLDALASLLGTGLVLATGVLALRRQVPQAQYVVAACLVFLAGIFVYALPTWGLLPTSLVTENGIQLGAALQLMLLSLAMAHRTRWQQQEGERIQSELGQTLEQRLAQRTWELDQAMANLATAHAQLTNLNHIDPLTGVWNRAFFEERFDTEWRLAMRGDYAVGLLLIELDRFSSINDTYGHPGGEACLKQVAHVIAQAVHRAGDAVFRYGGTEFVLILSNADTQGAAHVGELLRQAVAALRVEHGGYAIGTTISVGAASKVPELGFDGAPNPLIAQAERALAQAKVQGGNRVCLLDGFSGAAVEVSLSARQLPQSET